MQIIDFLFLSLLSSILKIIRVIIIKPETVYLSLLFFSAKEKIQFALSFTVNILQYFILTNLKCKCFEIKY